MADPQPRQIGDDRRRIVEREIPVALQSVRRAGDHAFLTSFSRASRAVVAGWPSKASVAPGMRRRQLG